MSNALTKDWKDLNWNDVAERVAALEGGAESLSIAQIKEVMRCLMELQYAEEHAMTFQELQAKRSEAEFRKQMRTYITNRYSAEYGINYPVKSRQDP